MKKISNQLILMFLRYQLTFMGFKTEHFIRQIGQQ